MKSNKEESSGGTGGDDGEANMRECTCEAGAACVLLFMDEVDALCPDRDGRDVESTCEQTRLVATLLTLLLVSAYKTDYSCYAKAT
jgi:SpoVK/Ycf46/Vps4 family AAA+-type ATPase